jgi:hypothetical protein
MIDKLLKEIISMTQKIFHCEVEYEINIAILVKHNDSMKDYCGLLSEWYDKRNILLNKLKIKNVDIYLHRNEYNWH